MSELFANLVSKILSLKKAEEKRERSCGEGIVINRYCEAFLGRAGCLNIF